VVRDPLVEHAVIDVGEEELAAASDEKVPCNVDDFDLRD
jgi:hypothetical protein